MPDDRGRFAGRIHGLIKRVEVVLCGITDQNHTGNVRAIVVVKEPEGIGRRCIVDLVGKAFVKRERLHCRSS